MLQIGFADLGQFEAVGNVVHDAAVAQRGVGECARDSDRTGTKRQAENLTGRRVGVQG